MIEDGRDFEREPTGCVLVHERLDQVPLATGLKTLTCTSPGS